MGKRWAWVAWFLLAFFVVGVVAAVALAVANGNNGGLQEPGQSAGTIFRRGVLEARSCWWA